MKKMILSVLAGLMVIGYAGALPTPENRKALCERHPDKYVWVEKTQACIPINPCLSDAGEVHDIYCVNSLGKSMPGVCTYDMNQLNLVMDKYAEKKLNTRVSSVNVMKGTDYDYVGLKTADGGYLVFVADSTNWCGDFWAIGVALDLYGYDETERGSETGYRYIYATVPTRDDCIDVANFAGSLVGHEIDYLYDFPSDKSCALFSYTNK